MKLINTNQQQTSKYDKIKQKLNSKTRRKLTQEQIQSSDEELTNFTNYQQQISNFNNEDNSTTHLNSYTNINNNNNFFKNNQNFFQNQNFSNSQLPEDTTQRLLFPQRKKNSTNMIQFSQNIDYSMEQEQDDDEVDEENKDNYNENYISNNNQEKNNFNNSQIEEYRNQQKMQMQFDVQTPSHQELLINSNNSKKQFTFSKNLKDSSGFQNCSQKTATFKRQNYNQQNSNINNVGQFNGSQEQEQKQKQQDNEYDCSGVDELQDNVSQIQNQNINNVLQGLGVQNMETSSIQEDLSSNIQKREEEALRLRDLKKLQLQNQSQDSDSDSSSDQCSIQIGSCDSESITISQLQRQEQQKKEKQKIRGQILEKTQSLADHKLQTSSNMLKYLETSYSRESDYYSEQSDTKDNQNNICQFQSQKDFNENYKRRKSTIVQKIICSDQGDDVFPDDQIENELDNSEKNQNQPSEFFQKRQTQKRSTLKRNTQKRKTRNLSELAQYFQDLKKENENEQKQETYNTYQNSNINNNNNNEQKSSEINIMTFNNDNKSSSNNKNLEDTTLEGPTLSQNLKRVSSFNYSYQNQQQSNQNDKQQLIQEQFQQQQQNQQKQQNLKLKISKSQNYDNQETLKSCNIIKSNNLATLHKTKSNNSIINNGSQNLSGLDTCVYKYGFTGKNIKSQSIDFQKELTSITPKNEKRSITANTSNTISIDKNKIDFNHKNKNEKLIDQEQLIFNMSSKNDNFTNNLSQETQSLQQVKKSQNINQNLEKSEDQNQNLQNSNRKKVISISVFEDSPMKKQKDK